MNILDALILGVVEGLTEFLPVSSTAHLTITEKVIGLPVADPGVTAFTAVIQVGAIVAVLGYFHRDILGLASAWLSGLARPAARQDPQYTVAWCVILGSVPIGIVGLAARHEIAGPLRNLWVVVVGLVLWSIVMYAAEKLARQDRAEKELSLFDSVLIGLVQCVALVPGVSRSGATISAGLLRGFDRVTATRLSFFLSIPALVAAGAYEAGTAADSISASVGWIPTIVATVTSFLVAYAAIAWLLRLVAHHRITVFIGYRLTLAAVLIIVLAAGLLSPT